MHIITELSKTIKERLKSDPKESYVALLHDKGLNKILEKIAEESTDVAIAFLFGQFSFGFTKSNEEKPKFFKHLAENPIFSGNCGFTKTKPVLLIIRWCFFFI